MWKAKVTSKGQITIPKEVRYRLDLNPGDILQIRETDQGYIIHKKRKSNALRKYVGIAKDFDCTSDQLVDKLRGEPK